MKKQINEALAEINDFVKKKLYFDFEVCEYWGNTLKIVGSEDLTYEYQLSIMFHDVFYLQCPRSWQSDTRNDIIVIPEINEQKPINLTYGIERGYTMIKIIAEDVSPIYISAKEITISYDNATRYGGDRMATST